MEILCYFKEGESWRGGVKKKKKKVKVGCLLVPLLMLI